MAKITRMYFLAEEIGTLQRQPSHKTKMSIIQATNKDMAHRIFKAIVGHRFLFIQKIGDLSDVKKKYRLTSAQVVRLNKNKYLNIS